MKEKICKFIGYWAPGIMVAYGVGTEPWTPTVPDTPKIPDYTYTYSPTRYAVAIHDKNYPDAIEIRIVYSDNIEKAILDIVKDRKGAAMAEGDDVLQWAKCHGILINYKQI